MNIYTSDKGFLCAEIEGKNLHSKYNPQREAERFISSLDFNDPSIIILLGAGLGYLIEQMRTRYENAKIVAIYYSDEIYTHCNKTDKEIIRWHPSSEISLYLFLERNISEEKLRTLSITEWNPSSLIYPDLSLSVNSQLKSYIQQMNGNIKTTAHFGKKWIRNLLCNYLSIDSYCTMDADKKPILIISSGPSLSESMEKIQKYQDRILLWALPSSLEMLKKWNITPDLLISTDPGYYGSVHLSSLPEDVPTAMPFTASRGLWLNGNPLLVLNQSLPFERDLFHFARLSNTKIPSNGTVSGTALELAQLSGGSVYFAGLDLCFKDIRSHCSPHSFDKLLASDTHRIKPQQSVYFHRAAYADADFSRGIRNSQSLDTYANWFNKFRTFNGNRIKRLNPSPVPIDNMDVGDLSELRNNPVIDKKRLFKLISPNFLERKKTIGNLLDYWEVGIQENLRDDLLYFIDTDAFTKGEKREEASLFISQMRKIYG